MKTKCAGWVSPSAAPPPRSYERTLGCEAATARPGPRTGSLDDLPHLTAGLFFAGGVFAPLSYRPHAPSADASGARFRHWPRDRNSSPARHDAFQSPPASDDLLQSGTETQPKPEVHTCPPALMRATLRKLRAGWMHGRSGAQEHSSAQSGGGPDSPQTPDVARTRRSSLRLGTPPPISRNAAVRGCWES